MAKKVTVKGVQRRMLALSRSISSLVRREIRLGKPHSYAAFAVIPPNTNPARTPTPWSGGN